VLGFEKLFVICEEFYSEQIEKVYRSSRDQNAKQSHILRKFIKFYMEEFPKEVSKEESNIEQPKLKEGVDFVFEQNPELESIGTKEQYSEYLDTIFPYSKVRDIVYHGTRSKFDDFDLERRGLSGRNYGNGVYTTTDFSWAKKYAQDKYLLSIILNIKNPLITNQRYEEWYHCSTIPYDKKISDYIENDSILNYEGIDRELLEKINDYFIEYKGPKDEKGFPVVYVDSDKEIFQMSIRLKEIVVPNTEQVHILGAKNDLQKFKEFVEKSKS